MTPAQWGVAIGALTFVFGALGVVLSLAVRDFWRGMRGR